MKEFIGSFKPHIEGQALHAAVTIKNLAVWWKYANQNLEARLHETRKRLANRLKNKRESFTKRKASFMNRVARNISEQIEFFRIKVRKEAIIQTEEECLNLSIKICEQFLGKLIPTDHKALSDRIRQEISNLLDSRKVSVKVSEKIFKEVCDNLSDQDITVLADHEIESGKAEICTPRGTVIIDWEKELNLIASKLFERLNEDDHEQIITTSNFDSEA